MTDSLESPRTLWMTTRANAESLGRAASASGARVAEVANALAGRGPVHSTPVHRRLSQQRRFVTVHTELSDYRAIREVHGGTVNDVILATIAGGLRGWLMARAESLGGLRTIKAIVPMSVIDDELEPTSLGSQITGHLVHLPIGEPSPVVRLHQVSYDLRAHRDNGRNVSARRLSGIAGFAPTTFHALGARLATAELRRGFHVSVTNVPGPQFPLYADGARMLESYPVHPLLPDHPLAIGVTSYDGGVFYGITTDRDAVPDADVLRQCLLEALDELKDSASDTRPRAPRGRKKAQPRRRRRDPPLPPVVPAGPGRGLGGRRPARGRPGRSPADDGEESEYVALMTAADASAELVAGLPDGRRRRVVVVAETSAADGAGPLARRGRGARRHRGRRGRRRRPGVVGHPGDR